MRNVFVFDAYGTLFNLHAAAERHRDAIGPKWQQLSQTWRTKHIEYPWVYSLSQPPAPAVYRLATERFGCAPGDISFQSSNRWDIAGAKAFGLHCVWINRTGAPDEYPGLRPDRLVRDLRGLLA